MSANSNNNLHSDVAPGKAGRRQYSHGGGRQQQGKTIFPDDNRMAAEQQQRRQGNAVGRESYQAAPWVKTSQGEIARPAAQSETVPWLTEGNATTTASGDNLSMCCTTTVGTLNFAIGDVFLAEVTQHPRKRALCER
jgi:hypothetical protein